MSTFTPTAEFSANLKEMEGKSITCHWDVVVCYNREMVNKLLHGLWSKKSKNANSPLSSLAVRIQNDIGGLDVNVDVKLGVPDLSFITSGSNAQARLRIPLSGSYATNIVDEEFPDEGKGNITANTFFLQATIPLAAVDADVKDGPLDAHAIPSDQVVTLGDSGAASYNIVMHFANAKGHWEIIQEGPGEPDDAVFMVELAPYLEDHFAKKINSIDLVLATVTSAQAPGDNNGLLQPEAFCFSTHGTGNPGDTGVLCIWIKTKGSGNERGNAKPIFNDTVRPIPAPYSASIIISHKLLDNKIFMAQLNAYREKNSISAVPQSIATEGKGFQYLFNTNGKFNREHTLDYTWSSNLSISKAQLEVSDKPIKLTIHNGIVHAEYNHTTNIGWQRNFHSGGGGYIGDVKLEVKLDEKYDLATVSQQDIEIRLKIESKHFKVTSTAVPEVKPEGFWQKLNAGAAKSHGGGNTHSNEVPDDLKAENLKFSVPEVVVTFPKLNFIAAESVLAPGMKFFKVDESARLQCPYDAIMVGHLVEDLV